jgi:hypothetical protein
MAPAATIDDNTRLWKSNGLHWQSPLRANIVLEEAHGPLVWQGQLLSEDDFIVRLEIQDILELEEAANAFDSNRKCRSFSPTLLIYLKSKALPWA